MTTITFEVEYEADLELLELLGKRLGLSYEIGEIEDSDDDEDEEEEPKEEKIDYLFGGLTDQKTFFDTIRDLERRERWIERDYDPSKVPF